MALRARAGSQRSRSRGRVSSADGAQGEHESEVHSGHQRCASCDHRLDPLLVEWCGCLLTRSCLLTETGQSRNGCRVEGNSGAADPSVTSVSLTCDSPDPAAPTPSRAMKQAASLAQTSAAPRQPQQQQQREQQFASTSVAPLRSSSNDAFAATTRAPLTAAAAAPLTRSAKPKASDLRASAASLSSTLPRPASDASPGASAPFLTSSFQIGSINGRMNFGSEERVFHRSDVPLKAREAHAEITRLLRTNLLDPQAKGWDYGTTSGVAIRGSKHCSWETALDRFDDRFFHAMESDHRVAKAHRRIETIRAGMDPDFDGRNIQPRWNVSTFVEDRPVTALSAGTKSSAAAEEEKRAPIKFLPEDYKSLLAKQTNFSMDVRTNKEMAAEAARKDAELRASWAEWSRAAHVDGTPAHPQLDQRFKPDTEAVRQSVEQSYPSEALTTFLWQMENPEAAAAAGLEPITDLAGRMRQAQEHAHHTRYAVPTTVHHAHRREQFTESESLPYSSKVPPAWYRAEARTKQIAHSQQIAPYAKFAHPGSFEWVPASAPAGTEVAASPAQHWTSGDELAAAGGTYRWSCCLHPLRDTRGCQAVGVDPSKRRVVVARSDDPSSSAAWGLGSSKMAGVTAAVRTQSLDVSHVRARSEQATMALSSSSHASPVSGGTAAVSSHASGMGLSGPGVAMVRRYEHSGRWEQLRAAGSEPEWLWSCCGSGRQDEQGCVSTTVTKEHRWQLDSA